jgi:hypothetical protein
MPFSVGDEIYKIKYFGDVLQSDKSKIYCIQQVYQWTSNQGIHTMGILDHGIVFELEFYDMSSQIHYKYAEQIYRCNICCCCF